MAFELAEHQKTAVKKMHNGCVLQGGVGTGKTITALAYYYTRVMGGDLEHKDNPVGEPRDIYVFTTAKKRDDLDWPREAAYFAISTDRDNSWGGIQLHVDSWNNIPKYIDVKDAFIILDEQRLVGSGAWVKAFLKLAKNNKWIMLSATPGDTWMEWANLFIAHGFYKNRTDFSRQHVVYSSFTKFPKIDRYVDTWKLEQYRRQLLVDMPYQRHTTRVMHTIPVDFDKTLFQTMFKDRWNPYEEKPIGEVGELFALLRRLVNSDASRIQAIKDIHEKHPRIIIFYNHNHELQALRELASGLGVVVSEWNGHKHQPVPDTQSWLYLVQYSAGAEGWNCIETDTIVFYSLTYSYKLFEQSQGRIDRLNTPFSVLHYYILRSNSMLDGSIWKALKNKKNFNEKALVKE